MTISSWRKSDLKTRKVGKEGVKGLDQELTPRQIVCEIDKYIIGQDQAKRAVAIALRNRSRRKKLDEEMQEEISPKNIIMMGPTGVGKTEIARRLSRLVNAPFIKVEITKYTEVGYVGRDVESMIRDLTSISVNMVKQEYSEQFREKAVREAEERILDILYPDNLLEEDSIQTDPVAVFDKEREKLRKDIRDGYLDDIEIEYEAEVPSLVPVMSVMSGSGLEDIDMQLQNMLGDMMPKKPKQKKMTVAEAKSFFFNQEIEKLIDMDKIVEEAVRRTEEMGIIFIDEIDKIAGVEAKSGPDVSRQGVQRDLLPVIEGTTVNTKFGAVRTNHILFIAAGAFNISKPSDLIPELQGRFPIRVELNALTEEDLRKILTVPRNSLTRQYIELLRTEGVRISFSQDAIGEIARIASSLNQEHENIGARRLHTVMEQLLEDILFDAPDLSDDAKRIRINAGYVRERLRGRLKDRDITRYIL